METLGIVYLILAITVTLLNTSAFLIIIRKKKKRSLDIIISSLLFHNILHGFLQVVNTSVTLTPVFTIKKYHEQLLVIFTWLGYCWIQSICLLTLFMTVHRYIAIKMPLKARICLTLYRTKAGVAVISGFNFILFLMIMMIRFKSIAIIKNLNHTRRMLSFTLFFEICLNIIIFLMVLKALRDVRKKETCEMKKYNQREVKALKIVLIFSCSFFIAYFPFTVEKMTFKTPRTVSFITAFFVWIDSIVNPCVIIHNSLFGKSKQF